MTRISASALGLVAFCLVGGCAFGDGEPFGVVTAGLDARYLERDDREAGEGFQKLTNEFQVRLDEVSLTIDLIELVDTGGGAAPSFDPANPPPGYSLCHGGHCHADDGRLVAYEDIAAELADGGEGARVALRLAGAEADLLVAAVLPLSCEESCVIGAGHLGQARLSASNLAIRGVVRDGLAEPRIVGELSFVASLDLLPSEGEPATALTALIDVPLDDDHDPAIELRFEVFPTAALFDGIDFSALPADATGAIMLGDDPTAAKAVKTAWGALPFGVQVARPE
jgi:hypothetical protein